ncbi:MAG: site-2 protease family protein [Desulfurococcales archaeon]|nr:site-2 protease family protein [Desulfurococcales archaeon]
MNIIGALIAITAGWTAIGIIYWYITRDKPDEEKKLIIYPLFFMLRIPYGFKSWEKYRGTILSKAYMVFTHVSAAISIAGIYFLFGQGLYTKYIHPSEAGGAVAGFVPVIPGVTIKGPLLYYIALAIGVGALFHELSHAFAARVNGIKVKNAGILLLTFIPAAFVEPDEEELRKASLKARAFVYNAGTAANLAIALVALLFLYTIAAPPTGVCIVGVEPNMPAVKAGLKPGDMIVAVNGTPVEKGGFTNVYPKIPPDVNFTLTIKRSGQPLNITVWKKIKENRSLIGISVMSGVFCSSASLLAYSMAWINLSLAFINMAPLYITDGGRLVSDFLERYKWGKIVNHTIQLGTLIVFLSLLTIPH